jgi:hypothetical protein
MIETNEGGGFCITGQDDIALYRLMVMRGGLRLECKGLKLSRGTTCYTLAKREFGFKGNKAKVLAQLEAQIEEIKAAR